MNNLDLSIFANPAVFVLTALCIFAIAYRFYGLFIARKVLELDGSRPTPAVAPYENRTLNHDQLATFGY